MRYWALSQMVRDPRLHHSVTWELMCAYHSSGLSMNAMAACNQLAAETPVNDTPLTVLYSVDAPMRRVYKSVPEYSDWLKLERAGFVSDDDTFGFVVDALH